MLWQASLPPPPLAQRCALHGIAAGRLGSSGALAASLINWLLAPPVAQPAALSFCGCTLSAFSLAELFYEALARVPRGAAAIALASFVAGFFCCVVAVVVGCSSLLLISREQASRCLRRPVGLAAN